MSEETASVRLTVIEGLSKDVGRGVVRLDPSDIDALGLGLGDTVLIEGERATIARVYPVFQEHRGRSVIQMDGVVRQNSGVGLGDHVTITAHTTPGAHQVELQPIGERPSDSDLDYIGRLVDGIPVRVGDRLRVTLFGSRSIDFDVVVVGPAREGLIQASTRLFITEDQTDKKSSKNRSTGSPGGATRSPRLTYEDVGGLRSQLSRIRETIELPLRRPDIFKRLGIDAPKGVLLHGPPGCGKTLTARIIAAESNASFFVVSGPEIVHKFYGESEAHLRKIFETAEKEGPSIIFIDEIDAIAPNREQAAGDVERRIVATLLTLMDGLASRGSVIVIAATNRPNAIDPALRRPGRFDREIEIPIPDRHGREEILAIHSRGMPLDSTVRIPVLAEQTHGYVGADLEALCREAAMACLRRVVPDFGAGVESIGFDVLEKLHVTMDDFIDAFSEIRPSATREVFIEVPDVRWEDVGGLSDTKDRLIEAVEWPLRYSRLFRQARVRPPRGILLAGPPGCGKTLLAKAAATETQANFISVKGPQLIDKFVGESERKVRDIFNKARQAAPCIIFFDEIDSIAPKRDNVGSETERRVVAQLLTLMDGLEPRQNVVVIGATNRVDAIDEALRRPGRFDREIVIGVPDLPGRRQIFNIHTRGMPVADDVDLDEFAAKTYGFVGADIAALARESAIEALRRILPEIDLDKDEIPPEVLDQLVVTNNDFDSALRRIQPSALREIMIQVPEVKWDDIGGLDDVKRALQEGVELPLKRPDSFERIGIRPARGFLLFGPPGTGKTLMAKAVAREAEANFVSTKSSDLLSKWYGESEKQISRLFQRARQVAPTVIFIDEIDSLVPARGGGLGEPAVTERVVNTLLAEMDGLEGLNGVVVIGATNRPNLLDPALLRPGRFDELVYVPVPDAEGRHRILEIHASRMPLASDVNLEDLAERTGGFTGADLENLTRRAGLHALRADLDSDRVTMDFFEKALDETRPSVTPKMEEEYEQIAESLKQESARAPKNIGFSLNPVTSAER